MRVLAILVGIILLLPGLCSLGFMVAFIPQFGGGTSGDAGPLMLLWLVCFAISFGGYVMIRAALRRGRPPQQPHE
jgi:hypothetical protein